jgi:hypothetical protein
MKKKTLTSKKPLRELFVVWPKHCAQKPDAQYSFGGLEEYKRKVMNSRIAASLRMYV